MTCSCTIRGNVQGFSAFRFVLHALSAVPAPQTADKEMELVARYFFVSTASKSAMGIAALHDTMADSIRSVVIFNSMQYLWVGSCNAGQFVCNTQSWPTGKRHASVVQVQVRFRIRILVAALFRFWRASNLTFEVFVELGRQQTVGS